MKTYELREGSFCMFRGDKSKNPKAPDWRGEGLIGGKAYEAAIWEKEGARGPWMSMSLKPKQERQDPGAYRPATSAPKPVQQELVPAQEEESDVPF